MYSATKLRRQGSLRLHARPGLPAPVSRIQPRAASTSDGCGTDWARNLRNRTGWHGIACRSHGVLVVFTIVLHRRTHYLTLRNLSSTGSPRCLLDTTICIADSFHELAHLEQSLKDDEVVKT